MASLLLANACLQSVEVCIFPTSLLLDGSRRHSKASWATKDYSNSILKQFTSREKNEVVHCLGRGQAAGAPGCPGRQRCRAAAARRTAWAGTPARTAPWTSRAPTAAGSRNWPPAKRRPARAPRARRRPRTAPGRPERAPTRTCPARPGGSLQRQEQEQIYAQLDDSARCASIACTTPGSRRHWFPIV